jgi:hypothetical protein
MEHTWDTSIARVDAAGIHFENFPDLQDAELPEWSHIRASDKPPSTRAIVAHACTALAARGTLRQELGQ